MAMKLSTGKIAFPIEFDNGDKQNIYFNPNDPELATRLMQAKDNITKRMSEINFDDFSLSNSGEAVVPETMNDVLDLSEDEISKIMTKAENLSKTVSNTKKVICEELNNAFDSDVSSVVFKYCSPFAIVNGNYYINIFFEAIAPEVERCIKEANAGVEKNMKKHIEKYARMRK